MAAAFDAISADQSTNNNQTPSWTHTPVGTPTAILVIIYKVRPATISSVTYGGAAMTLIGSVTSAASPNDVMYFYGIVNPASGAQTVQINASGTNFLQTAFSMSLTGSSVVSVAACFTGFQSDFADAAAAAADTLTVPSASDDLVIDCVGINVISGTGLSLLAGADQTERNAAVSVSLEQFLATSTQAGAASVAMDYSWGTSTDVVRWLYMAVNVAQPSAPGGFVPFPHPRGMAGGMHRLSGGML